MRYFVICNNRDTLTGLRMAGIEGRIAVNKEQTSLALKETTADKSIGILLINEKLAALCPEQIYDLKLHAQTPLVVEIPDRHRTGRQPDSITSYIREAIGIKL